MHAILLSDYRELYDTYYITQMHDILLSDYRVLYDTYYITHDA